MFQFFIKQECTYKQHRIRIYVWKDSTPVMSRAFPHPGRRFHVNSVESIHPFSLLHGIPLLEFATAYLTLFCYWRQAELTPNAVKKRSFHISSGTALGGSQEQRPPAQ